MSRRINLWKDNIEKIWYYNIDFLQKYKLGKIIK